MNERFQRCTHPECPNDNDTPCIPGKGGVVSDIVSLVIREARDRICPARVFEHLEELTEPTTEDLAIIEAELEDDKCVFDAVGCKGCEEYAFCKEQQEIFDSLPGIIIKNDL